MNTIKYLKLDEVNPEDFIPILNNRKIREHLIKHEKFTSDTIRSWIKTKVKIDSTQGCRIRAVICNNQLAGWCGKQLEKENHEIAIVLADRYWGLGKIIFSEIMHWAKDLGHKEVFIHFLHTRPQYRFLEKISKNMYDTDLLGNKFRTYLLEVEQVLNTNI